MASKEQAEIEVWSSGEGVKGQTKPTPPPKKNKKQKQKSHWKVSESTHNLINN